MTTIKERVLLFCEFKGFKKELFFKELGFSYANFKGIQKKSALNSDAIDKIISKYPELSLSWLITGNGEMINKNGSALETFKLKTDKHISEQSIPLYNMEAVAGLVPLFDNPNDIKTDEYINIPNSPKCDGALFVTGDSMYPLLKSGDIVAYKQITDFNTDIFWGEMYLISVEVSDEEYISVKFIQKSEKGEEYIKLVSQNSHHQPKDVHLKKVRAMALVKFSIRMNSMG
jgi:phage repressor protein C with HTH and peptisase S24 domain